MKLYYVVNARMPTDKAHGIQIAKMCEAFIENTVDVTLVIPSRGSGDLRQFYGLSHTIPLLHLPVLNLQFLGPIGYRLTALQFMCGSFVYLWMRVLSGEQFTVYTVDMDQFSFVPLMWVPRPLFTEMHSIKRSGFFVRNFFKRTGVIATNKLIAEKLAYTFNIPSERLRIEPNGVDESILRNNISQQEARTKLSLPLDEPFALYVGRFYAWKGLEILADAAIHSPVPIYLVGGTRDEYESVTKKSGGKLRFLGVRPIGEVPLYLAAADIVLVLGTAQNEDSYCYTSPMKIFEYLAARRAIVASRTPAIVSIMQENIAFWYEPDNVQSLAHAIRTALTSPAVDAKILFGYIFAAEHTWRKRAERIVRFIGEKTAMSNKSSFTTNILLIVGFVLVLFFSSFHLFNSPETWMDEGLITQSAVGLMHTGKAALPVAPGVYEPAWYITTGFPVTLPLATAFTIFGVSLEVARLIMLIFLLSLFSALLWYARIAIGGIAAQLGFFLLVFFGPLYGNGRNVLGEIPGLLFMILALLPLLRAGELTRNRALLVGISTGLAVATKPIFILFLPALLLSIVLHHRELKLKKVFFFGILGVLVPIVVWIFTQFDYTTFSRVLAVYANPHAVALGNALDANIQRVFTEMQPLYFLLALILWCVSYIYRRLRRETIALTEEVLLFFSVLVLLAYMRTAGYYRYFFVAQVFTVLYLPQSLLYLSRRYSRLMTRAVITCLCGLILFQAYETSFRSWTAVHYNSDLTESLEHYFTTLPVDEELFVYQAPEIVPFVGNRPLYQYVEILPSVTAGKDNRSLVLSGKMPLVITKSKLFDAHKDNVFSYYIVSAELGSYVILTRKNHE